MPRLTSAAHVRSRVQELSSSETKNSHNPNRRPSFSEEMSKQFSTFSSSKMMNGTKMTSIRRNSVQLSKSMSGHRNSLMATIDKMPKIPRRLKPDYESSSDDAMNECRKHPLGTDQSCCKHNVMENSQFDYSHQIDDEVSKEYCRQFEGEQHCDEIIEKHRCSQVDEENISENEDSDYCTIVHDRGRYHQHLLKQYLPDAFTSSNNWPNSGSTIDKKSVQYCRSKFFFFIFLNWRRK